MWQVARNPVDPAGGFLRNATDLIRDRDPVFTKACTARLKSSVVTCAACRLFHPLGTSVRRGSRGVFKTRATNVLANPCPVSVRNQRGVQTELSSDAV